MGAACCARRPRGIPRVNLAGVSTAKAFDQAATLPAQPEMETTPSASSTCFRSGGSRLSNVGIAMKTSLKITQDQIIDALCQLVRIKRVSGNEHEAVEWFKREFTRHGLQFKQSGRNLL